MTEKPPKLGLIATYVSIPFVLAFPPLVGLYIGRLLDKALNTSPVLMYVLLILGGVAGIRELLRMIKAFKE